MQKQNTTILFFVSAILILTIALIINNLDLKKNQLTLSEAKFKSDSIQVRNLLKKGNDYYEKRSSYYEIGEALIYYDSALSISRKINDSILISSCHLFIGNVYSAYNHEKEAPHSNYNQAYYYLPKKKKNPVTKFYIEYLKAHSYDFTKAKDSTKCAQILERNEKELTKLDSITKRKLYFISDFAWIATNIENYELAEKFLNKHVSRLDIVNDDGSTNFLDHYYISKAKIDIYHKNHTESPYIDSIEQALKNNICNLDKIYYLKELHQLYSTINEHKKAYVTLSKKEKIDEIAFKNKTKLFSKQANLLKQKHTTSQLKLKAEKKVRNRNLQIGITICSILLIVLYIRNYQYKIRRDKIAEIAKNKTLFTKRLLELIEDERKRIANDLHDSIGNELINLKQNINLPSNEIGNKIDGIIDEVRSLSRNIHPAMFERVGLKITLESFVEKVQYQNHFMLTSEINYYGSLESKVELQIYRIIQEATTNMIKHSGAIAGKITILESPDNVFVEIKDNGIGFSIDHVINDKKAFGLNSIEERSQMIKGTTNITSDHNGTTIQITILK